MKKLIVLAILGLSLPVFGAEAPPPTKNELTMALQSIQADKEKYIARYNWGQMMVEEAQRVLPDLAQREQNVMNMLKQFDQPGQVQPVPKGPATTPPPAAAEAKPAPKP